MLSLLFETISQCILLIGAMKTSSFLKPLNKKDEQMYIVQLKQGNKEARNKLIEHNLRLVAHIVKKYDLHNETQDLISIGTIGLIKAVDSYNPDKGKKLTTYASKCIENEILMYLRANKNNYVTLSLDEPLSSDSENSMSLLDSIIFKDEESVVDKITMDEDKKKLLSCFHVLDEKECEIIEKRYGLNGNKEYKQKEIAKELNISRSYVSRIEKRALLKLYRAFTKF